MKKGNITIEATFLIPMMFFVLAAMISMTFQVYEKTALPSVTYISLLRGSIEYEENEEKLNNIIKKEYTNLAENRLLFSSGQDAIIEIEGNNLQIQSNHNSKDILSQINRKRPVDFIRSCRKLSELNLMR